MAGFSHGHRRDGLSDGRWHDDLQPLATKPHMFV